MGLVCVALSSGVCGSVGLNLMKLIRGDFDLQKQQLRRVASDLCGINSETDLEFSVAGSGPFVISLTVARSPSTVCSSLNSHSKSFRVSKSSGIKRH